MLVVAVFAGIGDKVMIKLYNSGYSTREVADMLGINRKTVSSHLRENGVELRKSNNIKRSKWLVIR